MSSTGVRPRGESQVAPDEPTMPRRSVGASTGGSCRDDVKHAEAKPSAPDDPTGTGVTRRSNEVSTTAEDSFNTG